MMPAVEVRAHSPSGIVKGANKPRESIKRPPLVEERVCELKAFRERFAKQRALGGAKK